MTKPERTYLFLLCLLSLFLATYHLKDSYLLIQDTARDTLKILSLWQAKSLTLIGPPASFSLNTIREFYFGSLSYYLGLVGLFISNFDPIGATYATTILFTVSIPFIYLFIKNLKHNNPVASLGTLLYVVSPLTVTHLRFFWNPNTIIPLSVFYWFLVTHPKQTAPKSFIAGILAGAIFNLHYFTIFPMIVWQIILVITKKYRLAVSHFLGILLASTPLIFFEIKHQFYLTNALIYNLGHANQPTQSSLTVFVGRLSELFMAILGIKSGEIAYPTLMTLTPLSYWLFTILFFVLIIYTVKKLSSLQKIMLIPLIVSIIFAAKLSDDKFFTRYLFGCYPLAIWLLAEVFSLPRYRKLLTLVVIFVLYSNIQILSYTPSLATGFVPLSTLEDISKQIVAENIDGKYNLSENIFGDAQALGLRFFVQRDAINKPLDVQSYRNLDQLYVVSPSLNKIISDNRWEFYASGPWKLSILTPFNEVSLYRFSK